MAPAPEGAFQLSGVLRQELDRTLVDVQALVTQHAVVVGIRGPRVPATNEDGDEDEDEDEDGAPGSLRDAAPLTDT